MDDLLSYSIGINFNNHVIRHRRYNRNLFGLDYIGPIPNFFLTVILKSSDLVKWINEFICSRGRHHNTHVFKIGVHKGSQWAVLNGTIMVHAWKRGKNVVAVHRPEA